MNISSLPGLDENKLILGVNYGLGVHISTHEITVNVFARYEYDFIEIFKDPEVGSSNISLFQFGLSLPFIKKPEN